ncbi:MAG: hypothetical protein GF313_03540 [Caldithrix sp.]|nr:hypothetical protein [Caldithrix sp.]
MTAKQDYYAQVLFQLMGYKDQYTNLTFAKQWDDVAERIWNTYKDYISQDGTTEALAAEQTTDAASDEAKARALYDYVRRTIKTTGHVGLVSDDLPKPEDVLEQKEGSAVAKNLLLINLLNQAGVDAYPMLIRTRSNGKINIDWVQTQQFNRLITVVKLSDRRWFLNPGSPYCPFGQLTPAYNVDNGLLIKESAGKIINIKTPDMKNKIAIETDAQLRNDGGIVCQSTIEFIGMHAVEERSRMHNGDILAYLEDHLQEVSENVTIDSFHISQMDSIHKPLVVQVQYQIPDIVEQTGPVAFFEAPLLLKMSKNPFVREKRKFAVDYEFARSSSEVINITLPDAMSLSEKPTKSIARMKDLRFVKIYFISDNEIEVRRTFRLGRTRFLPAHYSKLRQTFEKIVQSDQDKIVLSNL